MADVVISSPVSETASILQQTADFFINNWGKLLFALILLICGIVIYYLFKKMEDERHERDEPAYQLFKSVVWTCRLQANIKKIKKNWSLINLLWFGIPIIKKEHSARIVDMSNNLIGWYRGECKSMDNTLNYLCYKNKSWLIIEETFILKIPLHIKLKTKDYSKKVRGKGDKKDDTNIKGDKDSVPLVDTDINLMQQIKELPNGDIKIYCAGVERLGLYYNCPIFVIDEQKGFLDYRKVLESTVIDNTYQVMVQRVLNLGARQVEKGMLFNPSLQFARQSPEKTKAEQSLEDSNV